MIELQKIYKIYGKDDSEIRALDGIDLTIEQGEYISIVGASGSGKSTCMNIIGCLDKPTSGKYLLNGIDVSNMNATELAHVRNRELGFIFQQYNLIQKLTILENVELPLVYKGIDKHERKEIAIESLKKVGLEDRIKKYPNQLSGGQQQRVSIARALAGKPPIILADEPTGALDSRTGSEIISFMQELNKDGTTIIIVTHDNEIAKKADRLVRIHDGKIIEDTRRNEN